MNLEFFSIHNHTDYSNFRGRDSICKTENLIDRAYYLNYKGVCITDHEALTSHVKAIKHYNKKYKDTDFKVGLGNEIYLVDSNDLYEAKNNNKKINYNHFILVAKNKVGYKMIRELSSIAWTNWFVRGVERVPLTYDELEGVINKYGKGNLIGSTACLGGYLGNQIIKLLDIEDKGEDPSSIKLNIHNFIMFCKRMFDDDFYIELQPNHYIEQVRFNKMALHIAKAYNIKAILTTDTHYLKKEDREIHKAFLQSEDGNEAREVDEFYNTTYMMDLEEMYNYCLLCMDDEDFKSIITNTMDIYNKIEMYGLEQPITVPNLTLSDFKLTHLFKDYYKDYPYIEKFAYSGYNQDKYFLYLIEKGFIKHNQEFNEVNLSRINTELSELWELSIALNQRMSAYLNIVQKVVSIIWKTSIVGVARGSCAGFYTAYLSEITSINPIPYSLPHWRFLTKERVDGLPDIDIDSERKEKDNILRLLKEEFSNENVVNISTVKTEGSKSSVLTACRGLGINNDIATAIASMIKVERGKAWSISDCLYGDEDKKPNIEFINEVNKYEGLKEAILGIENLISGRSIHAAGVILYNNGYIEGNNAIMRSKNGQIITAYTMNDSESVGNLKIDLLTVETLDKIRTCMDILVKDNLIEKKDTLKETYENCLHPNKLIYNNPNIWNLIPQGSVLDLFQFQTSLAIDCVKKTKPSNILELAHVNSLLRLSSDNEEQAIDRFVRYKNNISEWYKDMREYGLNEDEIKIMESHLLDVSGIAATQEDLMEMTMNPKISNFNLVLANKIRKGLAKKKVELIEECKDLFFKKGLEAGSREVFLNYVWYEQFSQQLG